MMIKRSFRVVVLLTLGFFIGQTAQAAGQPVDQAAPHFKQVILISVDGLRGDAISSLSHKEAPAFDDILKTGAATLNARADVDITKTMPDHLCMLTSWPVTGANGHNYTINDDIGETFHKIKGSYVASIFNVVHNNDLKSKFFATKAKFMVYPKSYGGKAIGKQGNVSYEDQYLIDGFYIADVPDAKMVEAFLNELPKAAPGFIFLHISAPDKTGHAHSWSLTPRSKYMDAVRSSDALIGKILKAIRRNKKLAANTAVIITSDHGGTGNSHFDNEDARNYTIPFLVWGKGVAAGSDLYALNEKIRINPGKEQIPYNTTLQPIRNGDAANLALSLLGLPPVPNSSINSKQDLNVFPITVITSPQGEAISPSGIASSPNGSSQ